METWKSASDNATRIGILEAVVNGNTLFLGLYNGSITDPVRDVPCPSCRTWYNKHVVIILSCFKEVCGGDLSVFLGHHATNVDIMGLIKSSSFTAKCKHGA